MTQITLAFHGGLAVLTQQGDQWLPALHLMGHDCHCLAIDPHSPDRIYCGTFDAGLWISEDAGATWNPTAGELPYAEVMSVAVSPLEAQNGVGVVWAGTEPSAIFRSEDGGQSWQERSALQELPSKPTWRFPPRPWTHHVRWIEPDPVDAQRLFVGIELGGVMRSLDGGQTWEDRKPGSQHDCHTLRAHPSTPGLLYETAGGGFAETHNGGATWRGADAGMKHHYLWGLAVDPGDPQVVVASASPGPGAAHNDAYAAAQLYRRAGDEAWQPLTAGLPDPQGTRAYVLATNPAEPGVFYAATRMDVYRSADQGRTWVQLPLPWPANARFSTVNALVVGE